MFQEYITIKNFNKEDTDGYLMDLEVCIDFDVYEDGVEDLRINSIWNIVSEEELNFSDFTLDELEDLEGIILDKIENKFDYYLFEKLEAEADYKYDS
jgi:hypothetical protein